MAAPGGAQTGGTESYRLVEEDIVKVEVVGRPDLSGEFAVDARGMVTLPQVGAVKAAGRTTSELASDLSRRFSILDRNVGQVAVSVAEMRSRKVFVLGSVLLPGAYSFAQMPTAWDAIAEAGGPTEDAILAAVEIIPANARSSAATTTVDIASAIRTGTLDRLPRLKPGDTIRVPGTGGRLGAGSSAGLVYVFGAMAAQGAKPLDQAPDVVRAVLSGNPLPDADFSDVEIVRVSGSRVMRMKVDLEKYFGEANPSGNPELQSGDTIYLPRERRMGFSGMLGIVGAVLGIAASVALIARN